MVPLFVQQAVVGLGGGLEVAPTHRQIWAALFQFANFLIAAPLFAGAFTAWVTSKLGQWGDLAHGGGVHRPLRELAAAAEGDQPEICGLDIGHLDRRSRRRREMSYEHTILATEIISALFRILPPLICFDQLAPDRPNYVNAPPLFRAALCLSGLFIMTSMADLIFRALHTIPPHPLATGYTTSLGEVLVAVTGHYWLQTTWKPASVRAQLNKKAELWERLAPYTRREQIVKERRRNSIPAKVAIGPCEPPKTLLRWSAIWTIQTFRP